MRAPVDEAQVPAALLATARLALRPWRYPDSMTLTELGCAAADLLHEARAERDDDDNR